MVLKRIKKLAQRAQQTYEEITQPPKKSQKKVPTLPKRKETPNAERLVNLSLLNITKVVVITILLIGLSLLLFQIRDVLMLFFVSALFAAALDPTVDKLEQKYRIPRSLSAIVIFLIIIAIISVFVGTMVPVVAQQLFEVSKNAGVLIGNIAQGNINLPSYLEWLNPLIKDLFAGSDTEQFTRLIQNSLLQFGEGLRSLAGNAFALIKGISNGLLNALFVLFFTYFMIVDEKEIDDFILKLFPDKYGEYITVKTKTIKTKVGLWLRGVIILMVLVGLLTYIGLKAIGIEYAFTLALFAALTEVIPVIGPIIAWVATIPIAANADQPVTALIWVTIIYFAIQRVETHLLVPAVMKQATGLHPIVVLLAMMIGFKLMGILGAVISVPVSAILAIFVNDFVTRDKFKT